MDLIDAYFTSVNTEDWGLMATLWHSDGELLPTAARPRRGIDEILAFYPKTLRGYSEHRDQPTRRITEGDTVVVEISFVGHTTAGYEITFDAVDVFDLDRVRIRCLSIWYDSASVTRQLGGE